MQSLHALSFLFFPMNIVLFFFPIIGAGIGYVIARLIVKHFLKFQPTSKTTLSGMIQKNRFNIIENISEFAARQINLEVLIHDWLDEDRKEKIASDINQLAGNYIDKTLPEKFPMIHLLGGEKITQKLKEIVGQELYKSSDQWGSLLSTYATRQIEVENIVEDRLKKVEVKDIHDFLIKIIRKQILNFTSLFVITGFLIGMIFMFISIFIIS